VQGGVVILLALINGSLATFILLQQMV
jgi:hypothetical protein